MKTLNPAVVRVPNQRIAEPEKWAAQVGLGAALAESAGDANQTQPAQNRCLMPASTSVCDWPLDAWVV